MMRPLSARSLLAVLALFVPCSAMSPRPARAQAPPVPGPNAGGFFTIEQPIRSEVVERLQASTRAIVEQAAARDRRPVLIFEVRPGKSDFGAAYDLVDFIQKKLAG